MITIKNTGPPLEGIEKFVTEFVFFLQLHRSTCINLEVCLGTVSYPETLEI